MRHVQLTEKVMCRIHPIWYLALLALALAGILPAAHATSPLTVDENLNLGDVTAAAMARNPDRARFEALRWQADALEKRARIPLDGPPALELIHKTDALASDTGLSEWESSIEFPLRRPGLQAATKRRAEGRFVLVDRQSAAWQLEVAGTVRDLLARLAQAEENVRLARQALTTAERLQAQVQQRLEMGDVPRTHLILAREESLQRQADLRQATLALNQVAEEYRQVTGLDAWPAQWTESPAPDASLEQHPALLAARADVQAAEAERAVIRERGRSQPTVGVNIRREEVGREAIDSVGISVSLPIMFDRLRAPDEAGASLSVVDAHAQASMIERHIHLAVAQAAQALAAARVEQKQSAAHRELADESLALARRAYSLGEIGLADLLRVRERQLAAQRRAAMSHVQLQRSIAEYNQARGVMP
ncbi:MAG: TolC family protein [Halothiobacillaceae bacterium]